MKKLFVAFCVLAMATGAFAAIAGSGHDFSLDAWNAAGGEICEPCHTPHNALAPQLIPLWNHTATAAAFTMYTSVNNTIDDVIAAAPQGCSRACLSCHDGATAVDAFGGAAGGILMGAINPARDLGTNLADDHPISVTYSAPPLDAELFDPSLTASGLGGTIQADMLFGAGQDQVECCSCHDAHNTPNIFPLLRKSNAASALCLTCHNK